MRALAGQRAVSPPGRRGRRGELLDRDPAAERDRLAAHGPCAQRHGAGHADPLPADARAAHQVDPRHRPRRDRHPDAGRAGAARRGHSRQEIGREEFVQRGGSGASTTAARSSSSSSAWARPATTSQERFTLDEGYARAVLRVFVALYDKGYIYRDRYMVNWDPGQPLGDLRPGGRGARPSADTLYSIVYDVRGRRHVTIATCAPRRCWATPRWR